MSDFQRAFTDGFFETLGGSVTWLVTLEFEGVMLNSKTYENADEVLSFFMQHYETPGSKITVTAQLGERAEVQPASMSGGDVARLPIPA